MKPLGHGLSREITKAKPTEQPRHEELAAARGHPPKSYEAPAGADRVDPNAYKKLVAPARPPPRPAVDLRALALNGTRATFALSQVIGAAIPARYGARVEDWNPDLGDWRGVLNPAAYSWAQVTLSGHRYGDSFPLQFTADGLLRLHESGVAVSPDVIKSVRLEDYVSDGKVDLAAALAAALRPAYRRVDGRD